MSTSDLATANSPSTAAGLPRSFCDRARRQVRTTAAEASRRALEDVEAARARGAARLLLTLDPSDPGAAAVLSALRGVAGPDHVVTRQAGASVLVDVVLDAA